MGSVFSNNSSAGSRAANSKFYYFPLPGRGEPARLALALGGVPFSDVRVEGKDWPALKPSTPWGSLPYLALADGAIIGQSRAGVLPPQPQPPPHLKTNSR